MPKIVTVEEMQAIEKAADKSGLTYDTMMRLAGLAVAHHLLFVIDYLALEQASLLFLIGPGNNGGDGLVAATNVIDLLPDQDVVAYLLSERDDNDWPLENAQEAGVTIVHAAEDADSDYEELRNLVQECDILIDGVFGTGARLPIEGKYADILTVINEELAGLTKDPHPVVSSVVLPHAAEVTPPYIVAVDCPSGLDCNTGEIDDLALPADSTVTFAAAKIGQLRFPGAGYVGDLLIGKIGIADDFEPLATVEFELADGPSVAALLPDRPKDSYKGTFGKVIVVGGSANLIGAPYLAGNGAYRVGAGWVTIAAPQIIVSTLAGMLPEATWLLLPHEMGVLHENAVDILRKEWEQYKVMLLGPGMGDEDSTQRFVKKLFAQEQPEKVKSRSIGFSVDSDDENDEGDEPEKTTLPQMVIDADGLNVLSKIDEWWKLLPRGSVLTPHPGEFVRLAGIEDTEDASAIAQVQANRIDMARDHAKKWNTTVVLKGPFTVVASPEGDVTLMPFATSALASAGTGDVLAGTIAGLVAQGLSSYEAAVAGCWLHGSAAVHAETAYQTPAAVKAGDVIEMLPLALATADELRHHGKMFKTK